MLVCDRARIGIAVLGYLASRAIPHAPPPAPDLKINWNPFTETWRNLQFTAQQPHGVPVGARHLLVLVLRRDVSRAVPDSTRRTYLGGDEQRRDC